MQYLQKSKKFDFKFLVSLCLDVFAIKLDVFTYCVAPRFYSFIIDLLLEVIGVM